MKDIDYQVRLVIQKHNVATDQNVGTIRRGRGGDAAPDLADMGRCASAVRAEACREPLIAFPSPATGDLSWPIPAEEDFHFHDTSRGWPLGDGNSDGRRHRPTWHRAFRGPCHGRCHDPGQAQGRPANKRLPITPVNSHFGDFIVLSRAKRSASG
jgi:hypothetical protein